MKQSCKKWQSVTLMVVKPITNKLLSAREIVESLTHEIHVKSQSIDLREEELCVRWKGLSLAAVSIARTHSARTEFAACVHQHRRISIACLRMGCFKAASNTPLCDDTLNCSEGE